MGASLQIRGVALFCGEPLYLRCCVPREGLQRIPHSGAAKRRREEYERKARPGAAARLAVVRQGKERDTP